AGDPLTLVPTTGWATGTHVLKFASLGRATISAYLVLGNISPVVSSALVEAHCGTPSWIGGKPGAAVPGAIVHVTDAAGRMISVAAKPNGSFFISLMDMNDAGFDMYIGDKLDVTQKVANMPTSSKVTVIAEK
ncbi:hypothetical protein KAH43_05590, partial [Candidatus Bipolaricaulota bacterium]|nr:hypothetical protein [Candidatus Bipolaricaulota bacterium]